MDLLRFPTQWTEAEERRLKILGVIPMSWDEPPRPTVTEMLMRHRAAIEAEIAKEKG
jgi:hypothetical protein